MPFSLAQGSRKKPVFASLFGHCVQGYISVHLRVVDVIGGEQFVDEAEVAGTVFRTMHRIEVLDEHRVRVVYRLEASGPAAGELGPAISADFDDTLRALVEYAGR